MNQLVETQISHATKIGKQVLLSNYKAELEQVALKHEVNHQAMKDCRSEFPRIITEVEDKSKELHMQSMEYLQATALQDTFEVDEADRNMGEDATYTICRLDPRGDYHNAANSDNIKETLASGMVTVKIQQGCDELGHNGLRFEMVCYVETPLSITAIATLTSMLALFEEGLVLAKEIATLGKQISEIDAHMERIEAELLVKELQSSESGKEVLALTESILMKETGIGLPVLKNA